MSWVTITFCSHNKPIHCRETIDSIMNQTFSDWDCIIYDSGVLFDQGYFNKITDPRIKVVRSPETDEMRSQYNMASWLFNRCKTDSEWIIFLCDDDLLYPYALQGYYEYSQKNPDTQAMYGHAYFSGPGQPFSYARAEMIRGRCANGVRLDCKIDGGQVCVKSNLLERHKWPEGKQDQGHADGLWMESIGEEVPFEPIDVMVLHNRNIPGVSLGVINL